MFSSFPCLRKFTLTVFKNHGFPLQGRLMNHGDIFLNSVGQFGKDGIRTTVEGTPIQVYSVEPWRRFGSTFHWPVTFYSCISRINSVQVELGRHKTLDGCSKLSGDPWNPSGHDFSEGEVCGLFWHSIDCILCCSHIQLFPFMFQSHVWYIAFSHSWNTIFPNSPLHYFLLPFRLNLV